MSNEGTDCALCTRQKLGGSRLYVLCPGVGRDPICPAGARLADVRSPAEDQLLRGFFEGIYDDQDRAQVTLIGLVQDDLASTPRGGWSWASGHGIPVTFDADQPFDVRAGDPEPTSGGHGFEDGDQNYGCYFESQQFTGTVAADLGDCGPEGPWTFLCEENAEDCIQGKTCHVSGTGCVGGMNCSMDPPTCVPSGSVDAEECNDIDDNCDGVADVDRGMGSHACLPALGRHEYKLCAAAVPGRSVRRWVPARRDRERRRAVRRDQPRRNDDDHQRPLLGRPRSAARSDGSGERLDHDRRLRDAHLRLQDAGRRRARRRQLRSGEPPAEEAMLDVTCDGSQLFPYVCERIR